MGHETRDTSDALVVRWQLADALRRLREDTGMTIEQAATLLRHRDGKWSRAKLGKIENGEQHPKAHGVKQLLDLYAVTDPTVRSRLRDQATVISERGYWQPIRKDVPRDLREVLPLEAAALAIRQLETMVIPDLLHTPDYTRALLRGASPQLPADTVERRVIATIVRQQILTRPDPPAHHIILDHTVLQRPVGGAAIMREQLHRLATAAAEGRAVIQILPATLGASPALDGPFTLLTMPDPIPEIAYTHGIDNTSLIKNPAKVQVYQARWNSLIALAHDQAETAELLKSSFSG